MQSSIEKSSALSIDAVTHAVHEGGSRRDDGGKDDDA
jgi:hypothetical protein